MKPDAKHSILLVDDHPLLLRGLRQLLEQDGHYRVVGEAANGAEALTLVAEHSPDLVILDRKMPVLDGLETLRHLRESGYSGKILLFTVSDLQHDVRSALRLGADGYLLKNEHPDVLLASIREVLAGGLEISEEVASGLRHRPRRESIS